MDIIYDIDEYKQNPINKALIYHLYGVISYTDERLKGEALELIEKSKNLKKKFYAKENLFFLDISPINIFSDLSEELSIITKKILDQIK